jgi:hypothetical protein
VAIFLGGEACTAAAAGAILKRRVKVRTTGWVAKVVASEPLNIRFAAKAIVCVQPTIRVAAKAIVFGVLYLTCGILGVWLCPTLANGFV